MHRSVRRPASAWVLGAPALLLAGCTAGASATAGSTASRPTELTPRSAASAPATLPQDAAAARILERVAPASLDLQGAAPTSTRCWTPSRHLFGDPEVASAGTWKVLCRVRYLLDGQRRYQDATCIGDFDAVPMLDHCYVWEYYSDEPKYRDGPRLASSPPTPLP